MASEKRKKGRYLSLPTRVPLVKLFFFPAANPSYTYLFAENSVFRPPIHHCKVPPSFFFCKYQVQRYSRLESEHNLYLNYSAFSVTSSELKRVFHFFLQFSLLCLPP